MLQELLNRDDAYLWAILSNGATLRLLRDSTALVGSSYVEFDLEAIFDGELFSDFVLLYLTCHESRFAHPGRRRPRVLLPGAMARRSPPSKASGHSISYATASSRPSPSSAPGSCPIRTTRSCAAGSIPRNADLKLDDFNRALLRLVYRMLFWFVAEDRGALLQPDPDDAGRRRPGPRLREARDRYAAYFSSARLRQLARRHRGGRHGDLFEAVAARLRRARHRGRRPGTRPARHRRHLRIPARRRHARSRWTNRSPAPACPTRRCSARSVPCPW